jgi:rhodanese-related sulfurtransferase
MARTLSEMIASATEAVRGISPADAAAALDAALAGNRSGRILVYCTKAPGARSLLAGETLTSMGFDQVEVLSGGLAAWSEAGLAVDGTSPAPSS